MKNKMIFYKFKNDKFKISCYLYKIVFKYEIYFFKKNKNKYLYPYYFYN